jgi:glycosyltransferase involved in cell wall biosynthesis
VLLRAGAQEFAPRERVRLEVLTYRGDGAAAPGDVMEQAVGRLRGLGYDPEGIADVELRLDPVPHARMAALYRSVDAVVLPTRGEGAGMPVFEAAACGTPVIATAFGGHEELMDPGIAFPVDVERMVQAPPALVADNGLYEGLRLAEPSVASLRARLREVAEDPEGARARAAGARALVEERFSIEAAGRALLARADAVLAGRPGSRVAS